MPGRRAASLAAMTDYGHALEFGVFVTPSGQDAGSVVGARDAGRRWPGSTSSRFQDHPYQPGFLDTWTLLSFVAARTSRVRVAPNVLNLPLRAAGRRRARSVASLDILSGGRVELGLGAGAFWDAIEAMGGPRLTPGQSVDALEEAIDVIRAIWDARRPGPHASRATTTGSRRGARARRRRTTIEIWLGAYKPRMLRLIGRKADGWLPSLSYLQAGDLAAGNAAIDEAARRGRPRPGRDPAAAERARRARRRPSSSTAARAGGRHRDVHPDDATTPSAIETFAAEVAPAVRELVAAARAGAPARRRVRPPAASDAARRTSTTRLGVTPTPDDGTRLSATAAWDESTRPRRPESGTERDLQPARPARRPAPDRRPRHAARASSASCARSSPRCATARSAPATRARRSTRWRCARTTGRSARSARATAASSPSTTGSRTTRSSRTSRAANRTSRR